MQVRLLRSVKDDTGWHKPGAVLEISKEEAEFLLKKKSAVPIEVEKSTDVEESIDDVGEFVDSVQSLQAIDGVNETLALALIEAGYDSVEKVADAKQPQLVKVKGIRGKSAVKIIQAAKNLIEE